MTKKHVMNAIVIAAISTFALACTCIICNHAHADAVDAQTLVHKKL